MDILQNNPYRLLGVYSNSPVKERLANLNRLKAFLKVSKPTSFPLDLSQNDFPIYRTEASVTEADAKLALPNGQMLYAQFWFVKVTPLDEVAFRHLTSGEMSKAEVIWQKKECASSLQNRIVCALIRHDLETAISCAEALYGSAQYTEQFTSAILGNISPTETANLGVSFIDALCAEVGAKELLTHVTCKTWREHLEKQAVKPLIEGLQNAVDKAKKSKGKGPRARLSAGETLVRESWNPLRELRSLLSDSNVQYQTAADKLGLEILQCGIDYYNDSEEETTAYKAFELLKYAQSIVIGQMATDRCDENVLTLEKVIKRLPPLSVIAHHEAIQDHLKTFAQKAPRICCSIELIKECAPHIVAIKAKLGKEHQYYLKISTTVVNEALGYVIAEVNGALKSESDQLLRLTLTSAWQAQLYLDKFDLETTYKNGRFKQNRQTLREIIAKRNGFEDSDISRLYNIHYGWCSRLNANDLDLRTDDENYQSCRSLDDYKAYLRAFPNGEHTKEVKKVVEKLEFQAARTVEDWESFIRKYPQGPFLPQAKAALSELKAKIARQDQAISNCQTISQLVQFYVAENSQENGFSDKCSLKAFRLAQSEKDYQAIVSTFGASSEGGKKAKEALWQLKQKGEKIAKRRKRIITWGLGISLPIVFFGRIYGEYGVEGLSTAFLCTAAVSGIISAICFSFAITDWIEGNHFKNHTKKLCISIPLTIALVVLGIAFEGEEKDQERPASDVVAADSVSDSTATDDSYTEGQYLSPYGIEQAPPQKTQEEIDYDTYINNQLKTGSKPYKKYYKSHTGDNYLDFKTSGCDYVIIVRNYSNSHVVNHIYVRANETGRLYLPNGTYNIYFYGGKGWNPNKEKSHVRGGFVSENGPIQKDEYVRLYDQYGEYTLYPVQNGNLHLEESSEEEAL